MTGKDGLSWESNPCQVLAPNSRDLLKSSTVGLVHPVKVVGRCYRDGEMFFHEYKTNILPRTDFSKKLVCMKCWKFLFLYLFFEYPAWSRDLSLDDRGNLGKLAV